MSKEPAAYWNPDESSLMFKEGRSGAWVPLYTAPVDELKECVHEFFTKYLNRVEESDSGRAFNPITIGCCRAMMIEPLGELLERMRMLSGAKPNPLNERENT